MGKNKVCVMEADKVVAEASVGSVTISAEDLKKMKDEVLEEAGEFLAFSTFSLKDVKRGLRKYFIREEKRNNRFVREMEAFHRNGRAVRVIYRCLRYSDRIPHKYRRKYGEVIRSMKRLFRCGLLDEPRLVGTKC